MNYYLLLGIPQDADGHTIRSAFRALARQYHPDAGEGSSAERFREILVAYETLNDPTRREAYDRILQNRHSPGVPIVEPLRPRVVPEPMLDPRLRDVRANRVTAARGSPLLNDLFDDWLRSWDELFFAALLRRRDRI
jgi:curved DNA-binding protein CbpA